MCAGELIHLDRCCCLKLLRQESQSQNHLSMKFIYPKQAWNLISKTKAYTTNNAEKLANYGTCDRIEVCMAPNSIINSERLIIQLQHCQYTHTQLTSKPVELAMYYYISGSCCNNIYIVRERYLDITSQQTRRHNLELEVHCTTTGRIRENEFLQVARQDDCYQMFQTWPWY